MRRFAALGVFALLIVLAHRASSQQAPPNRTRELAPGVFFWQGDLPTKTQTNIGWVVFQDYVFVVDANFPWGAREVLPEIKKTTNKPIRFVFNTHYHADHAAGNVVFSDAGASIVASEDSLEEAKRKGPADLASQGRGRPIEPLVHPSVVFDKRMVFDDGQHRVELTKVGPAHTKGDTVAYLPKEKILFVGDLAVNWNDGNNFSDVDADIPNWVRALDLLMTWDAPVVVPAHGLLSTPEILRGQRGYINAIVTHVQAGIKAGKSVDELAQSLDLTQYKPFGNDPRRSAGQIRTVYRSLTRVRTN